MRVRKNINCLSTNELADLREALTAMMAAPSSDPFSFARLAGFHGGPPTSFCAHGAPGFFTWHRAYLLAFENALRYHGCGVTLPFWDWSTLTTIGLPAACSSPTYIDRAGATLANPLYSGPARSGGSTGRRSNIDSVDFGAYASQAQTALGETSFSSFQSQMNGIHGGVHVAIGGDMGSVPTAAFDPIFYLHHANIDRLWARWQSTHPGPLPASEASFPLQPFNRPYDTNWQTGADVESTTALGYTYRNFCFKLPPFRLWEVIRFPFEPELARVIRSARVTLKAHHEQPAAVEVRVFVNNPEAGVLTRPNPESGLAGVGGFFGQGSLDPHGTKPKPTAAASDHSEHAPLPAGIKPRFDIEIDITAALRKASADKEVQLKLVALDAKGSEVSHDKLLLEEITLELD